MPNKIKIYFITLITLISFPLILLNTANAQVDERAAKSANVLYASMKSSASNKIPSSLLKITKCIIVIPSLIKAGILVTVERGKGFASCRHPETGKWGAPAFYNATGGSIGLSIGGGSFDIITLVTNELGVGELVSGKIILGSSKATAVAGSTGNVNITESKNASFITYAKPEDGLFAGADLGGIEIDFNSDGNLRAYGVPLSAYQTLFETIDIPPRIKNFHNALNQFAPPE